MDVLPAYMYVYSVSGTNGGQKRTLVGTGDTDGCDLHVSVGNQTLVLFKSSCQLSGPVLLLCFLRPDLLNIKPAFVVECDFNVFSDESVT